MDRRRWWRCLAALGVAAALAGCSVFAPREPVQVNVVGLDSLPGEGMELRLAVKLRVQNPNDQPLAYDGVAIALDVRGSTFATGVSDERGVVPRFGETIITVPVSVSAVSAVRQALGFATNPGPRIEYVLHGRLSGTGLGSVQFQSQGAVDLPPGLSLN